MDKYANRILAIIVEKTGVDPEDINLESYFEEDLNIGLIELYEIMDALEEEYQLEIDEDEREKIVAVKSLVNIITEKLD